MVDVHWDTLREKQLRYRDHTWTLTGDVEVRNSGEHLAVAARQADDVRRRRGTFSFEVHDTDESLNPGNLGDAFERLEQTGDGQALVVKHRGRTYRYRLNRLEYQ